MVHVEGSSELKLLSLTVEVLNLSERVPNQNDLGRVGTLRERNVDSALLLACGVELAINDDSCAAVTTSANTLLVV